MRWLCFWRPPCLRRRVMVNFTHDETEALEGVLWAYRGRWLTLKQVTPFKDGHAGTPLVGESVVHRSNIAWLQVLP